jgi:hypothetical protein
MMKSQRGNGALAVFPNSDLRTAKRPPAPGHSGIDLSTMHPNTEFRDRVIRIATELFPGVEFRPDLDHADVVVAGETRLGLQSIRAKFELAGHADEDLRQLVRNQFGLLTPQNDPSPDDLSLTDVRDQLFPQIMPVDYVRAAPLPIVSFPLAAGIRVGIVADFPQTYMYLRLNDLVRWGITEDEVYGIALSNLECHSKGMDIHLSEDGPNAFLAIETGDGYDAPRILVPGLQKFFASHLGDTFRFGIPNRDFLICWRIDCDETFHAQLAAKVAEDNSERPYPLSPSVFVRNSEGNIHEQTKR